MLVRRGPHVTHVEQTERDRGRWRRGVSGNRLGRPRGAKDRTPPSRWRPRTRGRVDSIRLACVLPADLSGSRGRAGREAWSSICRMHGAMALAQPASAAARTVRPLRQGSRRAIEFSECRPNSGRWRLGSLGLPTLVFPRAVGRRQVGPAAARDHRTGVLKIF